MNEILLNGKKFDFRETDLPLLIHGEDKVGGSLFTVSLIATLFSSGFKLLCLTGYHMARDEFYKQIGSSSNEDVIFCLREQVEDFTELVTTLPDINERVIVIKNIDLFDEKTFDLISDKQKIIISGDINKCSFKDKILSKQFETKVLFSLLEGTKIPELQKYEAFFTQRKTSGITAVKIS